MIVMIGVNKLHTVKLIAALIKGIYCKHLHLYYDHGSIAISVKYFMCIYDKLKQIFVKIA